MRKRFFYALLGLFILLTASCAPQVDKKTKAMYTWLQTANLSAQETPQELYQKALEEDTLVVYTITSRITEVKKSFEAQYPGLYVEVQDVKSGEILGMVQENYASGRFACDIVICNDNNAEPSAALVDTRIIYPYIPFDIAPKLKEGHGEDQLYFLDEAQMIFYNMQFTTQVLKTSGSFV